MIRREFPAMGTKVVVRTTGDPAVAEDYVAQCERRFSRFLPTSELSRLNGDADARSSLSADMVDVLSVAVDMHQRTSGLVDIGIGGAVTAWGYDRPYGIGLPRTMQPRPVPRATWSFDGGKLSLGDGVAIDLGGIAKGWVCDQLVEHGMAEIASAGGDLRSQDPSLVVAIDGGNTTIECDVGIGALATSSVLRRTWSVGDRTVSHLIDPRTMRPTQSPIVSATVIADTAVEAEAGAKAVLLHGVDGLAWADQQSWIRRAIAVWHDGSVWATKERMAA